MVAQYLFNFFPLFDLYPRSQDIDSVFHVLDCLLAPKYKFSIKLSGMIQQKLASYKYNHAKDFIHRKS